MPKGTRTRGLSATNSFFVKLTGRRGELIDLAQPSRNVRFQRQSTHGHCNAKCPLMTQNDMPLPMSWAKPLRWPFISPGATVRRREFIRLLGGIGAIPLAAHAQQGERIRRIAVFSSAATDTSDPEGQSNLAAFLQAMQELGWISGQNLRIDQRVGANNAERM